MLLSKQTNRVVNFIILLLLGVFSLVGSILAIIREINVDLSKANHVTGKVIYADLRTMKVVGFRFNTYKLIFYFRLHKSTQNFAVYHSSALYENITSNIKVGDTLNVIYRTSLNDYNTHVFQIQKGSKIIENYKDYNSAISTKAGMGIFLGVIILIIAIMWFKKISLYKLLTSWVNR